MDDGRLDAHIASVEDGWCRDCEVGEPHACPDLHRDYLKWLRVWRTATERLRALGCPVDNSTP